MMIALREAGAYSFLSMGAVIVLARRMIMQKDQMRIDGVCLCLCLGLVRVCVCIRVCVSLYMCVLCVCMHMCVCV